MKEVAGISPIVYHGTGYREAAEICKTNKFALNWALAKQAETRLASKHPYFLSTARNKNSRYLQGLSVVFKLDGRKLATRYKGGPIDYWIDDLGGGYRNTVSDHSEQEDRIYSNKPYIDAARYILEIEISLPSTRVSQQITAFMHLIQKFCKKHRIPLKFYENSRDMLLGRKPITELDIIPEKIQTRKSRNYNASEILGWLEYAKWLDKYLKTRKKNSDFWTELGKQKKITKGVKRLISYPRDIQPQFTATLHNASTDKSPDTVQALDELRRYMKYTKLKSAKDFAEHLIATRDKINEAEWAERKTTQSAAAVNNEGRMGLKELKLMAKSMGIDNKTFESIWDEAKEVTFTEFEGGDDSFSSYALGVLKTMLNNKKVLAAVDKSSEELDDLLAELDDMESNLNKIEEATLLKIATRKQVERIIL